MPNHIFDIEEAKECGIEGAVILANLRFWQSKNEANGSNFKDGKYWVYNSLDAWKKLFPYMTEYAIRKALKNLEDIGKIQSGNYNQSGYDRTKWYTVEINKCICRNQQMDLSKSTNGFVEIDRPIPDSKPDNKPDSKLSYGEDFESWFSEYHSDGKPESGKYVAFQEWEKLNSYEKEKCTIDCAEYVRSTPDHKYRKAAKNYLKEKVFNDPIVPPQQNDNERNFNPNDYV